MILKDCFGVLGVNRRMGNGGVLGHMGYLWGLGPNPFIREPSVLGSLIRLMFDPNCDNHLETTRGSRKKWYFEKIQIR